MKPFDAHKNMVQRNTHKNNEFFRLLKQGLQTVNATVYEPKVKLYYSHVSRIDKRGGSPRNVHREGCEWTRQYNVNLVRDKSLQDEGVAEDKSERPEEVFIPFDTTSGVPVIPIIMGDVQIE